MIRHELRDPDEARAFLRQGFWLQQVTPPAPETVRATLEWMLELAAEGLPLPPVGMVADVGQYLFGIAAGSRAAAAEFLHVPGVPPALIRSYQDHVLGRLAADVTMARASDALRRYEGRDRARGLAFLLGRFRERAGFGGIDLSPGVIKSLLEVGPEDVLTQGWESIERDGLQPRLVALYREVIAAVRQMVEALAPEDVFELEHRTALAEFGQRVALRQVLQAAARLELALSPHRPRPSSRRYDVPTRLLDEDTYPVGGFASIATRGSLESLLHSQLAFMEKDERPDLFDLRFLRDELLYYSRDENQFLRRRRTFAFVLFPDLTGARFKDAALLFQRGVLLLASLLVVVRKLSEWLSTDALVFEYLFLARPEEAPLQPERELVEMLLREQIANGTVRVRGLPGARKAVEHCTGLGRRALCHCLVASTVGHSFEVPGAAVTHLRLDGPSPALQDDEEDLPQAESGEPMEDWNTALDWLLRRWA